MAHRPKRGARGQITVRVTISKEEVDFEAWAQRTARLVVAALWAKQQTETGDDSRISTPGKRGETH
jgi:hypothetical protein